MEGWTGLVLSPGLMYVSLEVVGVVERWLDYVGKDYVEGPVFSIIDVCVELTDASGSDGCCGGAVVSGGEGLCGGGPGCLRLYCMIDSRICFSGINLGPLRQHCNGLVGSCIAFSCV